MSREIRTSIGALFLVWALAGCSESNTANGQSQTHWLGACASDAECGDALACVCDVCVAACSASQACSVPGRVTACMGTDAPSVRALCGAVVPSMVCLEACGDDTGCGAGQRCEGGACVPDGAPTAGSGGAGGSAGGGGTSGAGGTGGSTAGAGGTGGSDGTCPPNVAIPAICQLCDDGSCGEPTCSDGTFAGFVCPDGSGGSGGTAGAGGTGGSGGMCVPEGDACTIVGSDPDPCCPGTACSADVCTDSIPGMCSGTCQSSDSGGNLAWYSTCGDPVCMSGPTPVPAGQECTTQAEGAPCSQEGDSCLTGQCGGGFVCATSDPKLGPGGCPISRARYKRDIEYLGEGERRAYAEELVSMPLATYRYRSDREGRTHLGFIIEDVEPSMSVDAPRDRVSLYGYTSMAVAAIQVQAEQIEALGHELQALRSYLAELENQCGPQAHADTAR